MDFINSRIKRQKMLRGEGQTIGNSGVRTWFEHGDWFPSNTMLEPDMLCILCIPVESVSSGGMKTGPSGLWLRLLCVFTIWVLVGDPVMFNFREEKGGGEEKYESDYLILF